MTGETRASWDRAVNTVLGERAKALEKHGPLKTGTARHWRLLKEEYLEVEVELVGLMLSQSTRAAMDRVHHGIIELAQLAQLCIGIIEILQAEEAHSAKR